MMKPQEGQPVHWQIDGHNIEIKYPGKMFWPEENITKIELVQYYRDMADIMMPYLKLRPVTLHYFPRGIHKVSFYKRDYSHPVTGLIETYPYKEISQNKTINVPIVASRAGLIYLASKGCLEFHTWASLITDIFRPTWVVIDLDITGKTPFKKVLTAAQILREYLLSLNLQSFAKTSGGSGLHIYIPVAPVYTFEQVRNWLAQIGKLLQQQYPDIFALPQKQNKTHDSNKVVIDYRQNTITRNTASVYTARANSVATVSTPITWKEVAEGKIKPSDFTLKTVPERVKEKGDLFIKVLQLKQKLPIDL